MRFLIFLLLTSFTTAAMADPIRLHADNPRYFEFNGKTTVLVTSGEHYGLVLNRRLDVRKYLDTLAADGLNLTRVFTGSYLEEPGAFNIKSNTLAPAYEDYLAPWKRTGPGKALDGLPKFDLAQWDPAYFERLKTVVGEAAKRGIVVEITLFSSIYDDRNWKRMPFHPGNNINGTTLADYHLVHTLDNQGLLAWQEKLVRQIVRELNGFDNVIFEIQNEPWCDQSVKGRLINPYLYKSESKNFPNIVENATEASLAWQTHAAQWITSEESALPKHHLIAQNWCNFGSPARALATGVSIVNFHYAYPEAVRWNYWLGRAIAYDESGFIGTSDDSYRREAWRFMLAGGASFDSLDYSFAVGHEDGALAPGNGPGGGSPALRKQLGVLKRFLDGLPLEKMQPDTFAVRRTSDLVPLVLMTPGKAYGLYLEGKGPASIDLLMPPGTYKTEWIDPRTGEVLKSETVSHRGGVHSFDGPELKPDLALRVVSGAGMAASKTGKKTTSARRRRR